jgi:hypothetical protein
VSGRAFKAVEALQLQELDPKVRKAPIVREKAQVVRHARPIVDPEDGVGAVGEQRPEPPVLLDLERRVELHDEAPVGRRRRQNLGNRPRGHPHDRIVPADRSAFRNHSASRIGEGGVI